MPIGEWIKGATEGLLGGAGKIIEKFKADPTKVAELEAEFKKLVIEHEEKMESLAQRELETQSKDRDSARQRESTLRNTIGVWVQNIAAAFVIVLFGSMLFMIFWKGVPEENKEIFYSMLGVLGTLTTTIFNYWFGSSQGSVNKQRELNKFYVENQKSK